MIYSIICSRKDKRPVNFDNLLKYFIDANIHCVVAYDQEGVFQGYNDTLNNLHEAFNVKDDDIIILCHDDIQIFSDRDQFVKTLTDSLAPENVGFVGPVGTTLLGTNAMWWDPHLRKTTPNREPHASRRADNPSTADRRECTAPKDSATPGLGRPRR